jgi:D-alanyl-D-alanine dipeptidase
MSVMSCCLMLAISGADHAEASPAGLPDDFVYLKDVAPGVVEDMRYATAHNFTGEVVAGYEPGASCILTRAAAEAVATVQAGMEAQGLTLVVWDCYRPVRAVASFVAWTKTEDTAMKAEFYPDVAKAALIPDGYIADRSGHSKGSTIDLGIAKAGAVIPPWDAAAPLRDCRGAEGERFGEGVLDFGTAYDCFDTRAHPADRRVGAAAQANRAMLRDAMKAAGFLPYEAEWWHFRLAAEPYPEQWFDAPVTAKPPGAE